MVHHPVFRTSSCGRIDDMSNPMMGILQTITRANRTRFTTRFHEFFLFLANVISESLPFAELSQVVPHDWNDCENEHDCYRRTSVISESLPFAELSQVVPH